MAVKEKLSMSFYFNPDIPRKSFILYGVNAFIDSALIEKLTGQLTDIGFSPWIF